MSSSWEDNEVCWESREFTVPVARERELLRESDRELQNSWVNKYCAVSEDCRFKLLLLRELSVLKSGWSPPAEQVRSLRTKR